MKTFKERGFNDELDLDTLFTVVLNRLNSLFLVFFISLSIIFLLYIFQERVYQSNALLQFEETSSTFLPASINDLSRKKFSLNANKEIIKSFSTLEGVKNRLKEKYDINLSSSEIHTGISFSDDRNNLLTIYFASSNEEITQPALESVIEEFISDRIENNKVAAVKGIEFIDTEVPKLKKQLELAELELTKFRTSGGVSLIFDDENSKESIDSLNREIKNINLKEIELREFYKSTHPIYATLLKQKNILTEELKDIESGIQDLPSEQRKLFNLNQKVDIFSSGIQELEREKLSLNLIAASSSSDIRVINYPSQSSRISPRLTLFLFAFVFVFIAYVIFLVDHFLTDKIMSLDALLDYLEDRNLLIGAFPLINKKLIENKILFNIEKNFIDRILVNILNSDKKVYLITSMKGSVGKSYFCEKLFSNLSNFDERICLVDLDLRKRGISVSSPEFKDKGVSIENYLNNEVEVTKNMLLKKPATEDPLLYLNSESLKSLIVSLKNDFDKIIIDTPPIGTFIDAKIISKLSQQIICVLSSHESSFDEISSISKELEIDVNESSDLLFFLNKVQYFLEIFWFKVKYPIYGGYSYYNPYDYYSEAENKSFKKIEKYVSFVTNLTKERFIKLKEFINKLINRNQ